MPDPNARRSPQMRFEQISCPFQGADAPWAGLPQRQIVLYVEIKGEALNWAIRLVLTNAHWAKTQATEIAPRGAKMFVSPAHRPRAPQPDLLAAHSRRITHAPENKKGAGHNGAGRVGGRTKDLCFMMTKPDRREPERDSASLCRLDAKAQIAARS